MLVISDAHSGLVSALTQALSGAAWQRCTVHFVRNVLAQIPHKDKKQVADALKLIFDQPDYRTAQIYLEQLASVMQECWPKAAEMLLEAKEDILVYKTFPEEHHRSIHSVNPLERLNREIRRRTRVEGVFPDRASVYRLVGTLLVNTDEDWRAGRRYMGKEGIDKIFKRFVTTQVLCGYTLGKIWWCAGKNCAPYGKAKNRTHNIEHVFRRVCSACLHPMLSVWGVSAPQISREKEVESFLTCYFLKPEIIEGANSLQTEQD